MYPHRPDLLSFAFGAAFLVFGIIFLANPGGVADLDAALVLGLLAVPAGVGIAGSLVTGDVHLRAARRMVAKRPAMPLPAPPVAPKPEIPDEAILGPSIDPDELDRAFRETFGVDDPSVASSPDPHDDAGQRGTSS